METTPSVATARGECGRAGVAHHLGDLLVVDPVPGDLAQQQRSPPTGEALRWRLPAPQPPAARDAALMLEQPAEIRLHLQRRAPANLRHHVRRAVVRLAVLVVADMATFALLRALIRAARDGAVFGAGFAHELQRVLPAGYLNGWQFAAALFAGLLVMGNYGPGDRRRDAPRLFAACALATALPLWQTLWTDGVAVVSLQYTLTAGLVWAALVAERLTIDRITAWVRPPERDALETLFVGPAGACVAAMESPAFAARTEYRPTGFVDTQPVAAPGAIGHIRDFSVLLAASGVRVVVVCGYLSQVEFQDVVDTALAAGCQVLSIPRTAEIAGVHPVTVWRRGQPLVELTTPSLKGWQLAVKRVVDVIGAAVGLMLVSPVMAAIAMLIKIDSPGLVLFSQERVGLGGRRFRMLKFRTMKDGADAEKHTLAHLNHTGDARLFKIPNDPRVTRLGAALRRWSLDELPQLWNVLVGDMSLVGPRPFFEADLAEYRDHHFRRLGAKPGITGLWQVKGRSSVTDFEEVVRLDRDYVERWSLWLDVQILVLTLPAVIRRRGAF
ncbi:MAG: sugar transferase [Methanobacteriota archaeon]|nr:MAG: sugar transferase [Euryarchaeota archaeon]